ncbi:uncharacterized protein BYT42DRAFT_566201 [Radiomyces spectabilis]|uniref:uncharacterized protein n=1 Tax=Radiomyces spectabilis TaxID=64574 RepID=UPI00221EF4E7|nr:uncharacterized protein BYT42DRAFT_566201 [Radiomyces spectabilis]KAI8381346.1 hypothetical protein BYT42DRAFT_566201 [Radiomyces spectabilis]
MGGTISRAKHLSLKSFSTGHVEPHPHQRHTHPTPKIHSQPAQPSVTPLEKKTKKNNAKGSQARRRKKNRKAGSVSVRKKPKYKKVTKSIIGKPTNFKHTGHMGGDDILSGQFDVQLFSTQMQDIAAQINAPEYKVSTVTSSPASIRRSTSTSIRKRTQQRKGVRHHANLALMKPLLVEAPSVTVY